MADYIAPTKTAFNNAEQVAIDVLNQTGSSVITKTGSVIRELIVRPVAYLLSWVTGNISNDIKQYSVAYLKTSQLTENPVADAVASNYFVQRKQGTNSKGIITLSLTEPTLRIAAGARFTVAGTPMCTPIQYLIINDADSRTDTETIAYIKAIPFDNYYIANVPVIAVNPGKVELPIDSVVDVNFSCATLINAELTSPVTGGTDTETDAQLMARAEYNTAEAGIGTYYGLKKKMAKAPVSVPGLAVIAGEDAPLFRARFNNVSVNPGGFVDCHVKTCNQAIVGYATLDAAKSDSNYTVTVNSGICTGFIMVSSVIADGKTVESYNVSYGTDDPNTGIEGARLSAHQTATITFSGSYGSGTGVTVYMVYMPSISDLQAYMDKDSEHFIGQDIMIKAAIPVTVQVRCDIHSDTELDDAAINGIKQTIVDYINGTEVGVGKINFSDIRAAVKTAYPSVDLRLPCILAAEMYTMDGHIDTFYSEAGILDITKTANSNYWSSQICFFSCCVDNVRLNTI